MYRKILVALENSWSDETLLAHVSALARRVGSELLLVHVADGWVARNYDKLQLAESDEMRQDREYLEGVVVRLRRDGFQASSLLALGEPPAEIVRTAEKEACDLIALASHGHKLLGDILHGSTIHGVRHNTDIPVLTIRAQDPRRKQ